MAKTGGNVSFNETDRAIRSIVFVTTPIVVIYNILIILNIVPAGDYYLGTVYASSVSGLWVILSAYLYFVEPILKKKPTLRLILHQLLALATLIGITGFISPFTPLMAFPVVIAYLYYGWRAAHASIALFLFVATIDAISRMETHPTILHDHFAGVLGIVIFGLAITWIVATQKNQQATLEKSQQRERLEHDRMETIINNLADATFSVDEKGTVLMYNAACLDLLDTNDSIKGSSLSKLFNLSLETNEEVDIASLLKRATRAENRDDLIHTYADGESIRLEVTYAPIRNASYKRRKGVAQAGYILIARDVTKRKSLEDERDEFISVVSHELRTPITIAEGTISNIGVLLERGSALDTKLLGHTVDTAHEQILYLAKMINDLSTLSRAERGVGDEEEYMDVRALLHTMHNRYQKEASDKGLRLDIDLGTKLGGITASRLYTEELLQNFITNAIKYTKEGSVTIIGRQTKGIVEFSVKDTGIGIGKADQDKVFNKFYRSEDYRTRETGGTGLGLYVASKLARKLHTQIELKSRLNHGSTFSFSLPTVNDPSK